MTKSSAPAQLNSVFAMPLTGYVTEGKLLDFCVSQLLCMWNEDIAKPHSVALNFKWMNTYNIVVYGT